MRTRTMEISVGIFILAGIIALAVLALKVSGLSLSPAKPTYKLYAQFSDLGGLSVRGRVSIAGVTAGRISNIQLDTDPPHRNRSEGHTSELQSRENLLCRLRLAKKHIALPLAALRVYPARAR